MYQNTYNRRRFLIGAAASLSMGTSFARAAANERLNIAFIGYGKRSYRVLPQILNQPDTQVVALCEVEGERCTKGKEVVENYYAKNKVQL